MQSLPSFSAIRLPVPVQFAGPTGGRLLSVDATRELAKCANGELVSHEVVRDGIDALLQLKRASYDLGRDVKHQQQHEERGEPWGERGGGMLRTRPEGNSNSRFPQISWNMQCGARAQSSSDEEEEAEEDDDDCSSCDNTPPRKTERRIRRRTTIPKTRIVPPSKTKPVKPPPPPPPKNRSPTTWHSRKSESTPTISLPTPDSPKSKVSNEEDVEFDLEDEEEETTGPAVLHFSCLQCHRAKKRCNRTRPCNRCISRGMENECRYPDKHDPRSVLRACLRCWQTKKKCDRKQPSCGKCDKVGVKCVYRRENQIDPPEVIPPPMLYVLIMSLLLRGLRFLRQR